MSKITKTLLTAGLGIIGGLIGEAIGVRLNNRIDRSTDDETDVYVAPGEVTIDLDPEEADQ